MLARALTGVASSISMCSSRRDGKSALPSLLLRAWRDACETHGVHSVPGLINVCFPCLHKCGSVIVVWSASSCNLHFVFNLPLWSLLFCFERFRLLLYAFGKHPESTKQPKHSKHSQSFQAFPDACRAPASRCERGLNRTTIVEDSP
jgi:hypothetical protein